MTTRGKVGARSPRAMMAAAAVLGSLGCAQSAAAAATAVGGGAFAVKANINALVIPLDIGPLPSVTLPADGGGPLTATLLNTNVLGLAKVEVGKVSTEGKADPGTADSSATVANVDVAGLVKVKAASSSCSATTSGASGSAKVVDLVVAGIPLALIDLGPNTKISLPVGTVIINEQISGAGATTAAPTTARRVRKARRTSRVAAGQSITVNAVHVKLNALGLAKGDVILAQSRCSVG